MSGGVNSMVTMRSTPSTNQQQQSQQQQQANGYHHQAQKSAPCIMTNSATTATTTATATTSEDYLNKKITFIQNHINNLLIEITNLPEPWSYAVTEDGRVFFINETDRQTTWLHPKTGQPVSIMIIPPIEDLPNGWQKDYILGLPYLIDHNAKRNLPISELGKPLAGLNQQQRQQEPPPHANHHHHHKLVVPKKTSETNMESNLTSSTCSSSSASSPTAVRNNEDECNTNNAAPSAAIDSALRKCGWLCKLSQNGLKLWRKRYFVLTDYILDYYSDSTRTKHCGTIFLNNTHSRPTVKKDGSSAYNKKNSFKVELVYPESSDPNQHVNSDNYIYLAADSPTLMNEWISNFNFVSKMKNNSQNRNTIYEKRPASNRSLSNTSLRTSSQTNPTSMNQTPNMNQAPQQFMIKHNNNNNNNNNELIFNRRSSKSNSAPSSPVQTQRHSIVDTTATSTSVGTKKLRSSLSSTRLGDPESIGAATVGSSNKPAVKKKLAFSDDEILNDQAPLHEPPPLHQSSKSSAGKKSGLKIKSKMSSSKSDVGVDVSSGDHHRDHHESHENLSLASASKCPDDDFAASSSKHKRSSSLTKAVKLSNYNISSGLSSARSNRSSNTMLYDYRPIYEAFEKPIIDAEKQAAAAASVNETTQKQSFKTIANLIATNQQHQIDSNPNNQPPNRPQQQYIQNNNGIRFIHHQQSASSSSNYLLDTKKIAAATNAAAAAIEKEKDLFAYSSSSNSKPKSQQADKDNNKNKSIPNFYNLNKTQIEFLPRNEIQMLVRQLRRNFVLLNHSQQRFSLLHKLYEPYELVYQHRQFQQNNVGKTASADENAITDLAQQMHDSFQTISDRIKKLESKMDMVDSSLKLAQQIESANGSSSGSNQSAPTLYEDLNIETFLSSSSSSYTNSQTTSSKYANLLKLYEYQIVEMQYEYELLLEDKILVDKLLDNQMRVFSRYKNLSNEKFLIQQFNTLNQEMELLQSHISKANQLLNDTIAEKCKHELIHEQQQQQQQNRVSSTTIMATSTTQVNGGGTTPTEVTSAANSGQQASNSAAANKASLFRASLVPVGVGGLNLNGGMATNNSTPTTATTMSQSSESPTNTSQSSTSQQIIMNGHLHNPHQHMYQPPASLTSSQHQQQLQSKMASQQFGSSDNLLSSNGNGSNNNSSSNYQYYQQQQQPSKYGQGSSINRLSINPQHNLSYLVANQHQPQPQQPQQPSQNSRTITINNDMSKSIDSIYTPASSSSSIVNKSNQNSHMNYYGGGAFNSVRRKQDEMQNKEDSTKKTMSSDEQKEATNGSDSPPPIQSHATIQSHSSSSSTSSTSSNANLPGKEIHITFQPVNFTNYRPKPMSLYQQQQQQQQQLQQQQQNGGFKPTNTNFKRDLIAEKKRSSIGKSPHNNYYIPNAKPTNTNQQQTQSQGSQQSQQQQQTKTSSALTSDYFQPILVQHCQQSARERLFGSNNLINSTSSSSSSTNGGNLAAAMAAAAAAAAAAASEAAEQLNNRKIAFVKPEMRGRSPDNELINRFSQQNQMEYFDGDYSEEIVKNIQKPDVYSIPRGNIEMEPESELSEEERRAKERKVLEIKKMIALQSMQTSLSMNPSSSSLTNGDGLYSNGSIDMPTASSNGAGLYAPGYFNGNGHLNYADLNNFEREKRAREHLLDLKHELAEQIKEKTRNSSSTANNITGTNSSSNGGTAVASSSLSPSFSNDLETQIAAAISQDKENNYTTTSSIYVTKMAQTYDRMHANSNNGNTNRTTANNSLNESYIKSFVPISINRKIN